MSSKEPTRPLLMSELLELIASFKKTATASRDSKALLSDVSSQDTWHFFNGKLSALQELEAQLELYLDAFSVERKIDPTEWLRFIDINRHRTWIHPDSVADFQRNGGGSIPLYIKLQGGEILEAIEKSTASRVVLRYRLDPPVEFDLCKFDELFVVTHICLPACAFLFAYGLTPDGDPMELRLSLNPPEQTQPYGYFFCSDNGHLRPFIVALLERNILAQTGKRVTSGRSTISMFRFIPLTEPEKHEH